MIMLKTHHFNLDFFKKGIHSKEKIQDINDFEKSNVSALLTLATENDVTKEFVCGDVYYRKDRQEIMVFSFAFENANIFSCGFSVTRKESLKKDFLNTNFIKFIYFHNFLLESGFSKNNVVYVGNLFIDTEDTITSNLLAAFNDEEDFDFKYSVKNALDNVISFYDREGVNYEFLVDNEIRKFSIFLNTYKSSKELFLICKNSNNSFTLPITYLYYDKDYGEVEYITCQSGDVIIPDKDEEIEDLIVLLDKEGYTTLNILSSINKNEMKLKNNLNIKRNGYETVSLKNKSKYMEYMLKHL